MSQRLTRLAVRKHGSKWTAPKLHSLGAHGIRHPRWANSLATRRQLHAERREVRRDLMEFKARLEDIRLTGVFYIERLGLHGAFVAILERADPHSWLYTDEKMLDIRLTSLKASRRHHAFTEHVLNELRAAKKWRVEV